MMRETIQCLRIFMLQDTVGVVDAIRLDAVQQALLSLYGPPPGISTHGPDAAAVYFATRRQSVRDALGAAMERLLVDLNNHVKLLGAHLLHPCKALYALAAVQGSACDFARAVIKDATTLGMPVAPACDSRARGLYLQAPPRGYRCSWQLPRRPS